MTENTLLMNRIALEIQSNHRLILFDNALADFTPDELMMVFMTDLSLLEDIRLYEASLSNRDTLSCVWKVTQCYNLQLY